MNLCFIMYPWSRVDPAVDSTLRLIHEAVQRGHMVALTTPSNLTIRNSIASAYCDVIVREKKVSSSIPAFHKKVAFNRKKLPLAGFDVIVMRSNPPLETLALNFLDSVRTDTFIMNDIDGLRIANNKLYTTSFYDPIHSFIPTTHVSKNREYLQRVFEESEKDKMILKPLVGYGGQGVIVIEKEAPDNFRSLIDFYIGRTSNNDGNYVILQDYVEGADQGDVRILMLNGEPIGAYRRVPAKGDVRSNVSVGGKGVKHILTKEQKELCRFVGPKLLRDGIYFAGIDVIGATLIEVNVLSPGGITRINDLNKVKLQREVIDFLEEVVRKHELLYKRKSELRRLMENADHI